MSYDHYKYLAINKNVRLAIAYENVAKTIRICFPSEYSQHPNDRECLLYFSLTWRVTLFLESGIFCLIPVDRLPYFIYAGATNKCNFAFVSRFLSDSPFLSCEKRYRWWRRYRGHTLKARAALAVNNVFEDFVGFDWLHFKITVNWNGSI